MTKNILTNQQPILIFDGHCNLCNGWVDFVIKRDKQKRFLFTANQNEAGREILSHNKVSTEEVQTVYLWNKGKLYKQSKAALYMLRLLGFPYSLGWSLMIVPGFIRNLVYDFIARNRYKWFGRKESCRLPTPEEQAQFLP